MQQREDGFYKGGRESNKIAAVKRENKLILLVLRQMPFKKPPNLGPQ